MVLIVERDAFVEAPFRAAVKGSSAACKTGNLEGQEKLPP
jgi:hypothetical protein